VAHGTQADASSVNVLGLRQEVGDPNAPHKGGSGDPAGKLF